MTLALAFSVRRMLELSMLVRVLGSAETTGEVTALLIDKTGTVTENDQRVNRAWIAGVDIGPLTSKSVTWASEIANKTRNEPTLDPRVVKLLSILLAMNSTITYDAKGQILRGAKAEIALLRFVNSMNNDELFVATIRKYFPLVKLFPFNASRKRMCTLFTLRDGINDDEMGDVIVRAVTKGASQDVLNLCSSVMDENGAHHPLDAATKDQLSKKFLEWQDDAERVLLVAYKDIERDLITTHEATNICSRMSASDAESDLTLVAAIGMCDPLRPESTKSVRLCRRSGVAVKMVTGDSLSTATAVARRCGILDEKDMSTEATMTGEAFREAIRGEEGQEIDQSKLDAIWPNLRVLARASPQDKFILTDGIRNTKLSGRKEVVGVVGDGTNDAPALRRANVGFALGSGTECARDASDIVLLQDDFSSVVDAIRYGRNVFESIEKFITFQLTANCTTIILSTGCALVYAKSPLNAIELLFVNLVIDSLASLALATDEPSDDVMRQPPSDASNLITSTMRLNIFTQVSYQLAVMAYLLNEFGPEDTQIYCCFVLLQLANQINCRKVTTEVNVFKGATKNKLFVSLLTSEILLHVAIVQAGGAVFHTSPLNAGEWLRCTALALGAIPLRAFFVTFFVSLFAAFREEDALHHH